MNTSFRQGDVLLLKVDSLPDNAMAGESEEARIVLAYGEVTGHAHALSTEHARIYLSGDQRYIVTTAGATLVHEEHAPIALKPGVYRVVQQREFVPRLESGGQFIPMAMGTVPRPYRPVDD